MVTNDPPTRSRWTFLTNHAHVLLCIAREPDVRIRDIARQVDITERMAQRILSDLTEAGYASRERLGRRNRYQLHPDLHLRHPLEKDVEIGDVIKVLVDPRTGSPAT